MDEYDDGNAGLLKRVSDDGSNELDFGLGGMTQQSAQSYYDKLKTAQEAWQSKAAEAMTPEINYWKAQTEALKNLRMGPSRTEQLFQLSAALAQPTRYRGFGATLENVMPVLAAQEKAKRDAQMQQMELANKYMPEILQAQREQRKIALGAAPQDPQEFMQKYLLEAQKSDALRKQRLLQATRPIPRYDATGKLTSVFIPDGKGGGRVVYADEQGQLTDRKSTRLNSSHVSESRMPSSA